MKLGIYLCRCGTIIADKLELDTLKNGLEQSLSDEFYFKEVGYLCSEDGKQEIIQDLVAQKPDRVVFAACSPRTHEGTCMQIMEQAGLNPYYMMMVNIREHVTWVTETNEEATTKVKRYIQAAVNRVKLHTALERKSMEMNPDVLIVGSGPAGLKVALSLAEAGRLVTLIEKQPVLGGLPVTFEDVAPSMECGPCMLEPLLNDILHGPHADRIQVLTMAEIIDVKGFIGHYQVQIEKQARYVDSDLCIGCAACVEACPESAENPFNYGLNERKAIFFPFMGGLPNAPYIDMDHCVRGKGDSCTQCQQTCEEICGMEGIIRYDDTKELLEKQVGALVLAIGTELYDCSTFTNLGYGTYDNVFTSAEFERITASNGPTDGRLVTPSGAEPKTAAIIHCVGSLDPDHKPYCSGICCQYAIKYDLMLRHNYPAIQIFHFYKELCLPGKGTYRRFEEANSDSNTLFIRYQSIRDLSVTDQSNQTVLKFIHPSGKRYRAKADMIILCPASIPSKSAADFERMLDLPMDHLGFFDELHGTIDSAQSKIRGVYLAGSCQAPKDIQGTMNQAMGVTGYVLSELGEGKQMELDPKVAEVDEERCSGCGTCAFVCPYKAIGMDSERKVSWVNPVLCHGCGTCVVTCPAGAIEGIHFTDEEIQAELEGVLS